MAKITTSPEERLLLRLEQRKSFALGLLFRDGAGRPINMVGSTITLTWLNNPARIQHPEQVQPEDISTVAADMGDAAIGYVRFRVQASDLDLPAGNLPYSVTLRTVDGYSVVLAKGEFELQPNPETAATEFEFTDTTSRTVLDVTLQDNKVIHLEVGGIVPPGRDWLTEEERAKLATIVVTDDGVIVDLSDYAPFIPAQGEGDVLRANAQGEWESSSYVQGALDAHADVLGTQGTTLGEHTTTLGEHTTTLGEHTTALGEHTTTLGEHTTTLAGKAPTQTAPTNYVRRNTESDTALGTNDSLIAGRVGSTGQPNLQLRRATAEGEQMLQLTIDSNGTVMLGVIEDGAWVTRLLLSQEGKTYTNFGGVSRFLPFAIATGSVTITGDGTNRMDQAITFPAGRFTATPYVFATMLSGSTTASFQVIAHTVSSSGCTLRLIRDSAAGTFNSAYAIRWFAIQDPS